MNEVSFLIAHNQPDPHDLTGCLHILGIAFTVTHDKRPCKCQGKGDCDKCYDGKWHQITISWDGPDYQVVSTDAFATRILHLRQSKYAADWIMAFLMLVEKGLWEEALWTYTGCFIHGDQDAREWDTYQFTPRAVVLLRARTLVINRMTPHARQMLRQAAEGWLAAPYTDPELGDRLWCGFGIGVEYLREAIQPL